MRFPVTLPVTLPVTSPVIFEVIVAGSLASSIVPVRKVDANSPLNVEAVTIPVEIISPVVESIPTPSCPAVFGLPPTWNENLGSCVPTPTLPAA